MGRGGPRPRGQRSAFCAGMERLSNRAAKPMLYSPRCGDPGQRRRLMDDLCYLSATEARRMFRARTLSPVELMRAVIAQAGKVEPSINAFAETHYETALKQAHAS